MTAIDFAALLRETKRKAKQSKTSISSKDDTSSINNESTSVNSVPSTSIQTTTTTWNDVRDNASLKFVPDLDLQVVCQNPATILYASSPCLQNSTPLLEWLKSLPEGTTGMGNWKTMTYGKRKVCMFGNSQKSSDDHSHGSNRNRRRIDDEICGQQTNPSNDGNHTTTDAHNILNSTLPAPLAKIAQELCNAGIFPEGMTPNHVLLNQYEPGQGILPHTDGPLYQSRTATLSLGSDVVLEFTKRLTTDQIGNRKNAGSGDEDNKDTTIKTDMIPILLEAGSLIVFEGDAYLNYCHGISFQSEDVLTEECLNLKHTGRPVGQNIPRGKRFSLTFRFKTNGANTSV